MITGNNLSIATSRLNNDASITANSYSATADSFSNQGKIIVGGDFNLSMKKILSIIKKYTQEAI